MSSQLNCRKVSDRPYFIGGSDARIIMGDDEGDRLWRDVCAEVEREDLPPDVATEDPHRRWHEAITCGVPIRGHVAAVCYATAVILLGWWPWNFLLLLLLCPIENKIVRFHAFHTTRSNGPMRPRVFWRGSSL